MEKTQKRPKQPGCGVTIRYKMPPLIRLAFVFAGGIMWRVPELASIDADYSDAGLLLNPPRQSVIISVE
jgi:hypothetical protein